MTATQAAERQASHDNRMRELALSLESMLTLYAKGGSVQGNAIPTITRARAVMARAKENA